MEREPGHACSTWVRLLCLLGCAVAAGGCPQHGVIDDGTSISFGPANRGILLNPARLPRSGTGFYTPSRWAERGLRYGTDEMVALIAHVGREVSELGPGEPFSVADLSPRRGGPSAWHRSHQSGRDVDIIFLARDEQGGPVRMESMPRFQDDGRAVIAEPGKPDTVLRFDVERNWLLVRALIRNPIARVQYIFVYDPLRQRLLEHARATGEPEDFVLHAGQLMRQPMGALPHDDHFHVRIYCADTDRAVGCRDQGNLHWHKKDYKYGLDPEPELVRHILLAMAPMPAMMALVPVVFRR